jgi:hypothetical protein
MGDLARGGWRKLSSFTSCVHKLRYRTTYLVYYVRIETIIYPFPCKSFSVKLMKVVDLCNMGANLIFYRVGRGRTLLQSDSVIVFTEWLFTVMRTAINSDEISLRTKIKGETYNVANKALPTQSVGSTVATLRYTTACPKIDRNGESLVLNVTCRPLTAMSYVRYCLFKVYQAYVTPITHFRTRPTTRSLCEVFSRHGLSSTPSEVCHEMLRDHAIKVA